MRSAYCAAADTAVGDGDDWRACDLSDACDGRWIEAGNAFLTNATIMSRDLQPIVKVPSDGVRLAPIHVQTLVRCFARMDMGLDNGGEFDECAPIYEPLQICSPVHAKA